MPKSSTRETLLRQWEILHLLTHGGEWKTHTNILNELLEEGFGVTKRTIERDLEQLSDTFPGLECNKKGTPWGWRWSRAASFDIPGLSVSDALSFQLIKSTLRPLLPKSIVKVVEPKFDQASSRLKQVRLSNKMANWADKVYQIDPALPLIPPEVDEDVLEVIQSALMSDKQVDVQYRAIDSEGFKQIRLQPFGIVQRGATTYLVASAFNYGDILVWALHRMNYAKLINEPVSKVDGFDFRQYVESGKLHFGSTKPIKLKAHIKTDELVRVLEETPLSHDQKVTLSKGGSIIQATVSSTWQLVWWILSQGAAIEVLSPAPLRKQIANELESASIQYKN